MPSARNTVRKMSKKIEREKENILRHKSLRGFIDKNAKNIKKSIILAFYTMDYLNLKIGIFLLASKKVKPE
jgi:hypothetical protein